MARKRNTSMYPENVQSAVRAARVANAVPTIQLRPSSIPKPEEVLKILATDDLQKLLTDVQTELRARHAPIVPNLKGTIANWRKRNGL